MGPADVLPTGMSVAVFVVHCAAGTLPPGVGGRIHLMDPPTREAAARFLRQWPEGPQMPAHGAIDSALADIMGRDLWRQGR